jgi:hypothetical protein
MPDIQVDVVIENQELDMNLRVSHRLRKNEMARADNGTMDIVLFLNHASMLISKYAGFKKSVSMVLQNVDFSTSEAKNKRNLF